MPAPSLTTNEYLRTPEKLVPEELVWGIVREAASPTPGHQWIVGELFAVLREHVRAHRLGRVWPAPLDVVLDRDNHLVVQPDLVFLAGNRLDLVTDRVWGPPDLVVEVLSPRPRIGTLEERMDWFARYGVRECWIVHQVLREVDVVRFEGGVVVGRETFEAHMPIRSGVLPGFHVPLQQIFESGSS